MATMTIITAIIAGLCGLFLGYHWGRRDEREDTPPVPDAPVPDAPASVVAQGGGGPGIIK